MPQLLWIPLLFQSVASTESEGSPPADPPPAPSRPVDCTKTQRGDDILVCRRRDDEQYRLRPLPEKYVQSNQAQVKIGDGTLGAEAEQGRFDPQIMLRLRMPF